MIMKPLDQENSLEERYRKSIMTLLDLALDNNHDRARISASVLLSANSSWIRPRQEWLVAIPIFQKLFQCFVSRTERIVTSIGVLAWRSSLACEAHLIPNLLQYVGIDGNILPKRSAKVLSLIKTPVPLTGNNRHPTRRTGRRGNKRILEHDPTMSQSVECGSFHNGIT